MKPTKRTETNGTRAGWLAAGLWILSLLPAAALIPEPQAVVFGRIVVDGIGVGASDTDYVVEARRSDGTILAGYRMGTDDRLGDLYAVRIDLESVDPILSPLAAVFGETLAIVVFDGAGEVTRAELPILGRGQIEELNFQVGEGGDNGLPDAWELENFGRVGVSPNGDPDGDGLTTREEYEGGTDPNDSTDRVELRVEAGVSGPRVSFLARRADGEGYEGMTRVYRLEAVEALETGAPWGGVPGFENVVGDDTERVFDGARTGVRFFRLEVRLMRP